MGLATITLDVPGLIRPEYLTAINPATEEAIGKVKKATEDDVRLKTQAARNSLQFWSGLSVKERALYLKNVYDNITHNHEFEKFIAELITKDNGKPLFESYLEIAALLQNMHYLIKRGSKLLRDKNIFYGLDFLSRKGTDHYKPFGVIAIIQPWNYPFYLPLTAITKALIAGNTVVFKPSEKAPLVGELIEHMFRISGFPTDVVNVVHGDGKTGQILLEQSIDKVIFTGSYEVGEKIKNRCKEKTLELGGNDPAIVFKNANINNALRGVLWGRFTNCGQACASTKRVYVENDIFNEFTDRLSAMSESLIVGNGLEDDTDIGPLITEGDLKNIDLKTRKAISQGARVLTGGERINRPGFFYKPTILTDVNHDMEVMTEETFGPVLPVMPFKGEAEVIHLANDSRYGLAATIFTGDIGRGREIAEKLDCGTVWINDPLFMQSHPKADWKGEKDSGYGNSSIFDFVKKQHISTDKVPQTFMHPWQFPYKGKGKWVHRFVNFWFK